MEELALLLALVGGVLAGIGSARLTTWLDPWVGATVGFGCGALGIATIAGVFASLPADSTAAMCVGVALIKFGIAMSACHLARQEAHEYSPMLVGVAPVVGGVMVPEEPGSPAMVVGTYACCGVEAFVQPGLPQEGMLSGIPPRYVLRMTLRSPTPEWTVACLRVASSPKTSTSECGDEAFCQSLLAHGALDLIDRTFCSPAFDLSGQCSPTIEARQRGAQFVLEYSAWLRGPVRSPRSRQFRAELDLLVHLASLMEEASAETVR